jgi:hypothetical protein
VQLVARRGAISCTPAVALGTELDREVDVLGLELHAGGLDA